VSACEGRWWAEWFSIVTSWLRALEDYEHLVKEARGRRLFFGAPEASLLLLKPSDSGRMAAVFA